MLLEFALRFHLVALQNLLFKPSSIGLNDVEIRSILNLFGLRYLDIYELAM